MKARARIVLAVSIALLAAGYFLFNTAIAGTRGVDVVLINDGGRPIKDLRILFRGGEEHISRLASGGMHTVKVNPDGESDLGIEFLDSKGTNHKEVLDVYIERNYRGRIIVRIDSEGNLSWKNEVRI